MTSSGLSQRSSAKRSPSASSAASVPLKSKKSVPISEEDEDFYQEYEAHRSASDRDDDEDERDSKRVHRRSSSSARSRSSRSNQPGMAAQISFAQLLVFGTLMLQALTLFVTYHMLLTTQHGQKTFDSVGANISQVQIEVTRLHGEMSVISKQVIEIGKVQAATKRMVSLGNGSSKQNQEESENEEAANEESSEEQESTNSENAETSEEGQSNEESSENESSTNEEQSSTDEYSSDKYLNDDGSVNEAALESVIEQIESAHPPPLPSGARLKVGGNRLMTLRPSDLEKLHQYRNWTEDAQGKHYDAGPNFNQTNAIMEKLGQLIVSDSGEPIAPVDIAIVEHVRDDRTTIAARDIKRGEYFYKIHQDYLLTSIVVEHSEVGQELTANDFDGEEMVWMTAFILYEKVNPQSYWKFWLNILPISYRHMPQTFDWVNELDILENTMAGQWVSEYQLQYRREYISLASALRNYNFSQFSFAQYVWARLAVASRAFGLDVYRTKRMSDEALAQLEAEGKEPGTEMVHITCMSAADLINHQGEHRKIDAIWGWNEATHHFAFKAVKDIPAGTVIHTTYGPRGNSDIFVHYGFSLPGNPYNTAQLCVAGLKSSPLHSEKQSLLEEVYGTGDRASEWDTCSQRLPKNSPPGYMCRFHMDVLNDNAQECLQFARISVADEKSFKEHVLSVHENDLRERQEKAAENEEAAQDSKWAVLDIDPFDYQVEVEALGLLGDMAAIALRRFKGGPAINDTHLIQAGAAAKKMGICQDPTDTLGWYPQGNCLTHNQYNLLMVRQSEKAVLEGAVELGLMANAFYHLEPATIEDAYKFIARLSYTKEALDQMKKQDITPQYSHLRYFNEHFLPLYFRHKGWDVDTNEDGTRSPLAERNLQLYQLYRSIYVEPANEEDITDDDNDFAFE